MKLKFFIATAVIAVMAMAGSAHADTVLNTELGPIVGGTTTTDNTGTRSTNPNPATLASEAFVFDQWQQRNVRGGGVAGITTDFARSGNGSAYFSTDGTGPSKGDLEYYYSTPKLLSDFDGASYDSFRALASTVGPAPGVSFRLAMLTSQNAFAGYLVYEPYLNGGNPIEGVWQTANIDTDNSLFWSTNAAVVMPDISCTNRQACLYSIDDYSSANQGYKVSGISIGAGSGWTGGTFFGGADNVSTTFSGVTNSSNFEVAAVPEPASWALMIGGFGSAGAMLRRRRLAVA